MRSLLCGLGLVMAFAGPGFAQPTLAGPSVAETAPSASAKGVDAVSRAPRAVFVCDSSAMTRRAFVREFGAIEFVKAEAAVAKGEAWSAPKCVTGAEGRRLKQLAGLR